MTSTRWWSERPLPTHRVRARGRRGGGRGRFRGAGAGAPARRARCLGLWSARPSGIPEDGQHLRAPGLSVRSGRHAFFRPRRRPTVRAVEPQVVLRVALRPAGPGRRTLRVRLVGFDSARSRAFHRALSYPSRGGAPQGGAFVEVQRRFADAVWLLFQYPTLLPPLGSGFFIGLQPFAGSLVDPWRDRPLGLLPWFPPVRFHQPLQQRQKCPALLLGQSTESRHDECIMLGRKLRDEDLSLARQRYDLLAPARYPTNQTRRFKTRQSLADIGGSGTHPFRQFCLLLRALPAERSHNEKLSRGCMFSSRGLIGLPADTLDEANDVRPDADFNRSS